MELDQIKQILQRTEDGSRRSDSFGTGLNVAETAGILRLAYMKIVGQRTIPFRETPEITEYTAKIAKWLANPAGKPGLMLYGKAGNGKTTMAKAVCRVINMLLDSNGISPSGRKAVKQISALDLSVIARNDPDGFDRMKNTELLFLDDLGCEPVTVKSWGNEVSPVVELLYCRYDRQLFTIASSNLSDSDFRERYGDRIDDRMYEMFDRLSFTNDSFRR
jgi:DNA replication protein DnaC